MESELFVERSVLVLVEDDAVAVVIWVLELWYRIVDFKSSVRCIDDRIMHRVLYLGRFTSI